MSRPGRLRSSPAAPSEKARKLYVYNGGFLRQKLLRRILQLAGYDPRLGLPGPGDMVGVWGQSPTARRGFAIAAARHSPLLHVEDAFLRSVLPGRDGAPPLGLLLDTRGVHFDPAQPSDLEILLATHPLDDPDLLARADAAIAQLQNAHLSKYNAFDPADPAPLPGYVLVIDQTAGDAAVRASAADESTFRAMLTLARATHPGKRIIVKTHPETSAGHRQGHIGPQDLGADMAICADPLSPWHLLAGAVAVYTMSSQMGFEAILAGHRPVVLGQPFYSGWGLTDDRKPLPRRQRKLTSTQLFAAAMILYPHWYDPYHDRLCTLEDAILTLEAQTRCWREDRKGWVASGMRLWKRAPLRQIFGQHGSYGFTDPPDRAILKAKETGRRLMVWAGKHDATLSAAGAVAVEDGFLRSRGLGAALVAPLSLVCDDIGIYYDATRPSRLEAFIAASVTLPASERARSDQLIERLTATRLSKYNLAAKIMPANLPAGRRILVPGQVEDDASIRLGTSEITTNRALLAATRAANPDAVILYKPHPDVEAGLRPGRLEEAELYADAVLTDTDPIAAIEAVDEVWTMTSLLGFEALLRHKRVTCLGSPFYAGWGLTQDRAPAISRRTARPDLTALVHAVLIAYPRYHDQVTRQPCPVEVVIDRLVAGYGAPQQTLHRHLAKLQGIFASHAHLWR